MWGSFNQKPSVPERVLTVGTICSIFFAGIVYLGEASVEGCSKGYEGAYEDVVKNPARSRASLEVEHGTIDALCPLWNIDKAISYGRQDAKHIKKILNSPNKLQPPKYNKKINSDHK